MNLEHYDRQGNKIDDVLQWAALIGDDNYRRVSSTDVGRFWVSTVFLGIDHSWGSDGPPLIFETMVFDRNATAAEEICERYATEEEAKAGHIRIVQMIQSNVDFIIYEEPTLI